MATTKELGQLFKTIKQGFEAAEIAVKRFSSSYKLYQPVPIGSYYHC
jgi:hypothetical protein